MCYTFVYYLRGCTLCARCVPILRRNSPVRRSPFAVFLLASVSIKMFALDEKDPRRAVLDRDCGYTPRPDPPRMHVTRIYT